MGVESLDGKAVALGLAYLGRRERTVAEVRSRLQRAELPSREIDAALEELAELGMLDDARYARLFVEDKRNLDGWGSERIARALGERGVARDQVELALADEDREAELERAVELLLRRYREPAEDPRERERALGFLIRRGFGSELALDALASWRRG